MTNKDKKTKEHKKKMKEKVYKGWTQEERENYLATLVNMYPKHPKELLYKILLFHERYTFATDEERFKMDALLDAIGKQPDLTYFGKDGFQEEIEENKGFKVEYVNK